MQSNQETKGYSFTSVKIHKGPKLVVHFSKLKTILRILLSTAVTNCAGERSFSVLKRGKNAHRSTMQQVRLCALSIIQIESDIVKLLDIESTIEQFAEKNSQKTVIVLIKITIQKSLKKCRSRKKRNQTFYFT